MPKVFATRSTSALITAFGLFTNALIGVQILACWRSLRWSPEAMRPGRDDDDAYMWRGVDGVKLVWSLLLLYFASSAVVCTVGLYGVIKSKKSHIRFYRDFAIADFVFSAFFMAISVYYAFRSTVRTSVCEELSRQPELLRDLVEYGVSLENCEQWFERAVLGGLFVLFVTHVIRLHFLIAVSKFYSHLIRSSSPVLPRSHSHSRSKSQSQDSVQRIYLLPRSSTASSAAATSSQQPSSTAETASDEVFVYAPIPLSSLSHEARASATEAWLQRRDSSNHHSSSRQHRHHRSPTGRIVLPIAPGEGLLPSYEDTRVVPYKA